MIRVGNFALQEIAPGVWRGEEYNCGCIYMAVGEKKALLIDTGCGTCDLDAVVRSITALPYDVVLTHGHRDHSGGSRQFAQVYLHEADRGLAESITLDLRQDYVLKQVKDEAFLKRIFAQMPQEGAFPVWKDLPGSFDLGGKTLEVLPIFGHTAGSVCLLDKTAKVLLLGDTISPTTLLLAPGEDRKDVVRTWLSGIRQLKNLTRYYSILASGHGLLDFDHLDAVTELAEQYLRGDLEPEFAVYPFFHTMRLKNSRTTLVVEKINL